MYSFVSRRLLPIVLLGIMLSVPGRFHLPRTLAQSGAASIFDGTTQPSAVACGEVSRVWQPPTYATWTLSSGAVDIERCLYTAYQQCSPATLVFSSATAGVEARQTFSVQPSGDTCGISDSTAIVSSATASPVAATVICPSGAAVTQAQDGLHINCGIDVLIPSQ